ncbi:MAG: PepSY domain-containing protein [Cyanobacteria bacterium]|nr:PepSY domain-containing protein [Cyanobacteriota bacterium]
MKSFRTVLFWAHLAAGTAAGMVILIMCVTGVALTYEKQMLEWADRRAWPAPSSADARPLPPETLLAKVVEAQPGAAPIGLTLRADAAAPATVTLDGNKALLVDPYTGAIIGPPPTGLRTFFRTMTVWHRYIAMEGDSRATGRGVTGAANLIFLFIVISGLYLWVPRLWTWIQFKNVLWFRSSLAPKARDFNWHNVIGFWSALPLAIVVAGAVPISYPWASNLVYRIAGDTPPPPPAQAARPADRTDVTYISGGIDGAWSAAQAQIPSWRTMTTRLAASANAPVVISVDEGYGGQPQKRTTFTITRASGAVVKAEDFQSLSAGRRLRTWLRFAHTGEIYGLSGQTIAGLASLGGAMLVYTGLMLALRRLASWIGRQRALREPVGDRPRAA